MDPFEDFVIFGEDEVNLTEDNLKLLDVEVPSDWNNALLDEWVNEDLFISDDLMEGIGNVISERAMVGNSPVTMGSLEHLLQLPLPVSGLESVDNGLNRSVVSDSIFGDHERDIPLANSHTQTTRRRMNCAEWNDKRPLITSIYIDQGKSLAQTRKMMADDHGFHASEKAYKDKIREWKLVKNLKRRQRVYMLKMERKRREEEGKATTFFHHGNIVPEAKLYRYSKTVITDPTISAAPSNITFITTTDSQTPKIKHQQRANRQQEPRRLPSLRSEVRDLTAPEPDLSFAGTSAFLNLKQSIVGSCDSNGGTHDVREAAGKAVSAALDLFTKSYLEVRGSYPASLRALAQFCVSPSLVQEVPFIRDKWESVDLCLFMTPLRIWQVQCLIAARFFPEADAILYNVTIHCTHAGEKRDLEMLCSIGTLAGKLWLSQRRFKALEEFIQQELKKKNGLCIGSLSLQLQLMLFISRIYRLQAVPRSYRIVKLPPDFEADVSEDLSLLTSLTKQSAVDRFWTMGVFKVLETQYFNKLPLSATVYPQCPERLRGIAKEFVQKHKSALQCSGSQVAVRNIQAVLNDMTTSIHGIVRACNRAGMFEERTAWLNFLDEHSLRAPTANFVDESTMTDFVQIMDIVAPTIQSLLGEWPPITIRPLWEEVLGFPYVLVD